MQHIEKINAKLSLPLRDVRARDAALSSPRLKAPSLDVDHPKRAIIVADHKIGWAWAAHAAINAPAVFNQLCDCCRLGLCALAVVIKPVHSVVAVNLVAQRHDLIVVAVLIFINAADRGVVRAPQRRNVFLGVVLTRR